VGLLGIPGALWIVTLIYLLGFFLLNILSPILAGKWQVSATVIKLIPLGLVAVVGIVGGLISGQTIQSFTVSAANVSGGGLAVATLATAFAYEGWIIATSINAELRDAKRTLPKALLVGASVVVLFYMLYYLGISGVLSNAQILEAGDGAPVKVISLIFGRIGGTVLTVFVIISCLGTLNGLIMGSVRGMYSIASRNMGPHPGFFKRISPRTNSTINSALIGLVFSLFWMVVWYGNFAGWWGSFMDISELPIAFLYIIYIAIYIWVMRTFTDLSFASRFIAPLLSGAGSLYIIFGAVQKAMFGWFFIITMLIIGVSLFFMKKRS
jgi:APA family basic amino acid/polyamine antiporter